MNEDEIVDWRGVNRSRPFGPVREFQRHHSPLTTTHELRYQSDAGHSMGGLSGADGHETQWLRESFPIHLISNSTCVQGWDKDKNGEGRGSEILEYVL